jgi:signal peptidase I
MEEKTAGQPRSDEQLKKKLRRSERSVRDYQYFLLRLIILLLLLWVLFFKLIGVIRMPTGDMYPRIDAGDLVMFYRLDTNPSAQDVVALRRTVPTLSGEQTMVLRVVAVAGDTVEVTETGFLKINGNVMDERNIFYPTPRYENYVEYPLTLEEGECFALADSRNGGTDSRFFGPVLNSEILGTVITIVRRNTL